MASNLFKVQETIRKAALKVGREPKDIKLVAVTKTVDPSKIKEAIKAGVTIVGENYVQEAKEKIAQIDHDIQWHMIGHLQTNKAKHAVKLFDMIQSVDSLRLAEELNKQAKRLGTVVKILIQVNVSGEESKFGVSPQGIHSLISQISNKMENLSIQGLMTMPPYFNDPERTRPYFRALRELRDRIVSSEIRNVTLGELSMGISNDYEMA
ncbi:MAG TPA: YggS family pyridoxal phosphate-dependent enzyme, partial [Syntrophaceae bacterium]|nr:YggS family pyridoxal phosphate-dependent enzyme [Syntrophaceae bacterium]